MYGAVANSVNTWFAQLAVRVGPERAVVARRMGITNIPPRNSKAYASWNVCSLVLGAREVSVLDMAGAFGVLANKGVRCAPYSITKVVAPGERKPLIENKPDCKQVISEKISTRTVAMLRGVITGGTGGGRWPGPAGGRQDRQRPEQHQRLLLRVHAPAVHLGLGGLPGPAGADAQPVQRRPGLRRTFPAIIFKNYMDAALAGQPVAVPGAAPRRRPRRRWACPAWSASPADGRRRCWPGPGSAARSSRSAAPSPRDGPPGARPGGPPAPGQHRRPGRLRRGGGGGNNVIVPGVVGPGRMARTVLAQAGPSSGLAYTNSGRRAGSPPRALAGAQPPSGSYVTLVVSRRS